MTPKQTDLFNFLFDRGGDVPVREIYLHMGFDPTKVDVMDDRCRSFAQASLTGPIARLNRAIRPMRLRVAPGRTPLTYRLKQITE